MPDIFIPQQKKKTKKVKGEAKKPVLKNTPFIPAVSQQEQETPLYRPQENHIHALASFCQNPINMSFESQEPNETILLYLRKHFITNVPWIVTTILLLFLPNIINFFFRNIAHMQSPLASLLPNYEKLIIIFYYLLVFAYAFVNFITWFYNISIVTNIRVIDIDFSDLVYQNVAVTKVDLIEDVDYIQIGFIRSLFNYGDIFVQTAGEDEHFDFLAVPNPVKATKIILDLIGASPHA